MNKLFNGILHKIGYQICKYPDESISRRMKLIKHFKINKLIDVGANYGGYALFMRRLGFVSEIISFEPLSSAFLLLNENSKNDKNWKVFNFAIGNEDKTGIINVAGNSHSSSLNRMLETHIKVAPLSKYVGTEKIEIKKLDSIFSNLTNKNDSILLKIDTQGYEKYVLEGAANSLKNIQLIQLEMSLTPLYENELLITDMINYLKAKNFELASIERGFFDKKTGRLLQVDGLFYNNASIIKL
jgi:FkbM family methyltransferase